MLNSVTYRHEFFTEMGEPFSEREMGEFLDFAGLRYESDEDEGEGEGEDGGGEEDLPESSWQPGAAEAAAAAVDGHCSPRQEGSSRSGDKRRISITRQQFRRLPCWLGEESAQLRQAVTEHRESDTSAAELPALRGVQGGKAKSGIKLKSKGTQKSPKKQSISVLTREERDADQVKNALGAFAGEWADKPVVTEQQQQIISAIYVQRHYRQNMKRQLIMGRMTPMPRRSRSEPGRNSARNSKSSGSPSRASGWGAKSRNSTGSAAAASGISCSPTKRSRSVGGQAATAAAVEATSRTFLRRGLSRSTSLADDSPRSQQPVEPPTLSTATSTPNFNLPSPRASPRISFLASPRAAARSREENPALSEDPAPSGLQRSSSEGVPSRAFARSRRATPPIDSDRLSRKPSQAEPSPAVSGTMVPEPSRQPTTTPEPVDNLDEASYTI